MGTPRPRYELCSTGLTDPLRQERAARRSRAASRVLTWVTKIRRLGLQVCVLGLGLVAIGLWLPSTGSAESLCTDTWTGAAEGSWRTASNWSAAHVPTSTDVACIGVGKTVNVTEGSNVAGVTQGEGTLAISGGSLEVSNALEPSNLHGLTLTGGTLTGAATVNVSSSFTWTEVSAESTMSGTGSTVVRSGVAGTLGNSRLVGRKLVNEGTLTLQGSSTLRESEGAVLNNTGTFNANQSVGNAIVTVGAGTPPSFVNAGTFQKSEGSETATIEVNFENPGTINASTAAIIFPNHSLNLASGTLKGTIRLTGATVTGESFHASAATVEQSKGTMTITGSSTATIGQYSLTEESTLAGSGTLDIATSLVWTESFATPTMSGSGSTVLQPGATASARNGRLAGRRLVNEGTFTLIGGDLKMSEGAVVDNAGTFNLHQEQTFAIVVGTGAAPLFVNTGTFAKTDGIPEAIVEVSFENLGSIVQTVGQIEFTHPVVTSASTVYGGGENVSAPGLPHPQCGDKPVTCATGNESATQTDLSIGGRGVGLDLSRTYNSQAAAAGIHGALGYGWSSSFSDHLSIEVVEKRATLTQADGSTVVFAEGTGGIYTPPAWDPGHPQWHCRSWLHPHAAQPDQIPLRRHQWTA